MCAILPGVGEFQVEFFEEYAFVEPVRGLELECARSVELNIWQCVLALPQFFVHHVEPLCS